MDWAEKVKKWTVERGFGSCGIGPAEAKTRFNEANLAARWQRDQLRTPEAIERVARGIHDHECACGDLNNEEYGEDGTEYFIDKAKAAISALMGED